MHGNLNESQEKAMDLEKSSSSYTSPNQDQLEKDEKNHSDISESSQDELA